MSGPDKQESGTPASPEIDIYQHSGHTYCRIDMAAYGQQACGGSLRRVGPHRGNGGRPRLLSLAQRHKTVGLSYLPNRKILALVGALLLSIGAFLFAAREAQAQAPTPEQYTVATEEEVAEPIAETPLVESTQVEVVPADVPTVETFPADPAPPADHQDLGTSPSELAASAATIEPALWVAEPPEQHGAEMPVVPETSVYAGPEPTEMTPVPSDSGDITPEPSNLSNSSCEMLVSGTDTSSVSGSTRSCTSGIPAVDGLAPSEITPTQPVPAETKPTSVSPVDPEPNTLLSAVEGILASGWSVRESAEAGPSLPPNLQAVVSSAVETLEGATTNALENVADGSLFRSASPEDGPVGAVLASLLNGGEAVYSLVVELVEDFGSSSERGTPSQVIPKPTGGFFSLSDNEGDDVISDGVTLVLFGILASAPILLRRWGRFEWVSSEVPKLSSALLLPLERPG